MFKRDRLERLVRILNERNLDACFIGPDADLIYLADLNLHQDKRVRAVMISRTGSVGAIVPSLYKQKVADVLGPDVPLEIWQDHEGFTGAFKRCCERVGITSGKGKRVAVNACLRAVDLIDAMGAVDAEYVNGSELLAPLRRCKDASEIDIMRRAGRMADQVIETLVDFIRPGLLERDIAKKIAERFEELGADSSSFNPIVASGPNSSMPHYDGNSRTIQENDVIILDLGCMVENYCSDISRTVFVGEPTPKQREIYEIVRRAQAAGEAAARPGVAAQDVDRAARKIITDAGYGPNFLNRTGHGIGMEVHETPYIVEGNTHILEVGNSFSVEPGISLPGEFGMRVENCVVVTPNGCESFNNASRDLTICRGR